MLTVCGAQVSMNDKELPPSSTGLASNSSMLQACVHDPAHDPATSPPLSYNGLLSNGLSVEMAMLPEVQVKLLELGPVSLEDEALIIARIFSVDRIILDFFEATQHSSMIRFVAYSQAYVRSDVHGSRQV